MTKALDLHIPKKLLPIFKTDKRNIVLYGGRGGGKSYVVADLLLLAGTQRKERILCTREFQNSIGESVHQLLKERIEHLRLSSFYTATDKYIEGRNGTYFFYKGLYNNENSIKSTQGITKCWVEESHAVSRKSLDILLPTIRTEGSQVYMTLNPTNPDDCVYKDFVLTDRDDTLKIEINYNDNPFFPDVLKQQMEIDRARDADLYAHKWQGQPILHSDAQVFKGVWSIKEFEAPEKTHFFQGVDWGFSADPTAAIRSYIVGKQLFVEYEVSGRGVDIDRTPALLERIPGIKQAVSYADNSRPETISYMRAHGFPNMRSCDKWKGSVEDGIAHLRGYDIVVHPRCTGLIQELRLYQYEIDKNSGQVTNKIKDADNHFIDALRYSLNDVIKRKTGTVNRVAGW